MMKISDGQLELEFETTENKVQVTLEADKYQLAQLVEYELFLGGDDHYFSGEVKQADEEQLVLTYTVPTQAMNLADYAKKFDRAAVLRLLPQIYWLTETKNDLQQPFIAPENLYVVGQRIMVLHRGFRTNIAPFKASDDLIVKQFRALILYLLDPKQDYEKLVNGAGALRNKFAQTLAEQKTTQALKEVVDQQIMTQEQVAQKSQITVKKSRFQTFKWLLIIGSILAAILLGVVLFWGLYTLPKEEHIIKAQSRFMNNNYVATTTELKKYSTKSLPQSAKYVLAVSYINLDTLSQQQKEAVLKNVSQNSDPLQLNYWIELGRGNYSQALNLAKNIGDDEYILHAYTKLYTTTKNNTTMDGAKKQAALTKYRKQINKYLKKLGSDKNEFEAD